MIGAAADLLDLGQEVLFAGFAVFLRIGAAAALMPAFGEQVVPVRVRLAGALALTAIVAPALAEDLRPAPAAGLAPLVLTETVIGLSLGAVLRLLVMALQMAGAMAAQATSLAQIFGGQAAEPLPAIGHVLTVAGLALLAMSGLHLRLVEFLLLSYDLLPAGRLPRPDALLDWGLDRVQHAFNLAFVLAAPFVIASLLYNLTLGVINRAMPQLMVALVGAPAIAGGGLAILALTAPGILAAWIEAVAVFLADPLSGRP